MGWFKVKTSEIRVCEVAYEVQAKTLEGAQAAVALKGNTLDDDIGEIASEVVAVLEISNQTITSVQKLAKKREGEKSFPDAKALIDKGRF